MTPLVLVQTEDFDLADEIEALTDRSHGAGAVVSFLGLCRDEGGRLSGLELEHYPGMAEAEVGRVVAEAAARWPLLGVTAIHRYGLLRPGDRIVLVATCSAHREAAFAAASYVMDFLKTRAPFWKREHLRDGTRGPWIDATTADARTAERWGREG